MFAGDGMKRKIIMVCALLMLLILYGVQYRKVNTQYPAPINVNVRLNENVQVDGIEIKPLKAELLDGQQIQQVMCNSADTEYDNAYDYHDMKLYLMTILCRNVSSQKNNVDFTQWMIEAGAWGNGINGEFFKKINENISIIQDLKPNEEVTVKLPFTMVESMFPKKEWGKMSGRNFNIIISLYPEKIILNANED